MDTLIELSKLPFNGAGKKNTLLNNKKFRLLYEEIEIDNTIDAIWKEVAGNFVNGGEIAHSINYSKGLTGDLTSGLGAERLLNINFQGKTLEVKERIVHVTEEDNFKKFTYDVYETKGSPLNIKTYNTWSVRKSDNGKVYLGNLFVIRAKPAFLTGLVSKKLKQSGSIRTGLLSYKHYLETGQKRVEAERLNDLYPIK